MKNLMKWGLVLSSVVSGLTSCGLDIPKEEKTSYETLTVETSDMYAGAQAVIALYIALGGGTK